MLFHVIKFVKGNRKRNTWLGTSKRNRSQEFSANFEQSLEIHRLFRIISYIGLITSILVETFKVVQGKGDLR